MESFFNIYFWFKCLDLAIRALVGVHTHGAGCLKKPGAPLMMDRLDSVIFCNRLPLG